MAAVVLADVPRMSRMPLHRLPYIGALNGSYFMNSARSELLRRRHNKARMTEISDMNQRGFISGE